jgi:hypothetical protein
MLLMFVVLLGSIDSKHTKVLDLLAALYNAFGLDCLLARSL